MLEIEELIERDKKAFIIARKWITGDYDQDFLSRKAIQRTNEMIIVDIDAIDGPPFSIHNINNSYYFRPKQNFNV